MECGFIKLRVDYYRLVLGRTEFLAVSKASKDILFWLTAWLKIKIKLEMLVHFAKSVNN